MEAEPTSPTLQASRVAHLTTLASRQPTYLLLHLLRRDVIHLVDTPLSWDDLTSLELNYAIVRPLTAKYASSFSSSSSKQGTKQGSPSLALLYAALLLRLHFRQHAARNLAYQPLHCARAMLCELLAIKLVRVFHHDHGGGGGGPDDYSVGEYDRDGAGLGAGADVDDGLPLIVALTTQFDPWVGASDLEASDDGLDLGTLHGPTHSALELALLSDAKRFLHAPLVQRVVQLIWDGTVLLSPPPASVWQLQQSSHLPNGNSQASSSSGGGAILNDAYKRRPLRIYHGPRAGTLAAVLDHSRLRVPRIRSALELLNFTLLLLFYALCLAQKRPFTTAPGGPREPNTLSSTLAPAPAPASPPLTAPWSPAESLFTLWLLGFALDEAAQATEHGLPLYFASVWNVVDAVFVGVGAAWLLLRLAALHLARRAGAIGTAAALGWAGWAIEGAATLAFGREGGGAPSVAVAQGHTARLAAQLSETSFDILALGAVLLCPRVASSLVRDNVTLLALRAMIADFVFFMLLACLCFSGFLFSLYLLSDHAEWPLGRIAWLLLKIWFGSSYLAFDTSASFSPYFGPILFLLYAIVSNTLLLTVLVSLLSNTYVAIAASAPEQVSYHHCSQVLAGLSTDALFSYTIPANLLCLAVVWPASYVLTPRWLHKLNVFMIRATGLPVLLAIHAYERITETLAAHQRRRKSQAIRLPTGDDDGGGGGAGGAEHSTSTARLLRAKMGRASASRFSAHATAELLDAVFYREDHESKHAAATQQQRDGAEREADDEDDKASVKRKSARVPAADGRAWERAAMRRVREASLDISTGAVYTDPSSAQQQQQQQQQQQRRRINADGTNRLSRDLTLVGAEILLPLTSSSSAGIPSSSAGAPSLPSSPLTPSTSRSAAQVLQRDPESDDDEPEEGLVPQDGMVESPLAEHFGARAGGRAAQSHGDGRRSTTRERALEDMLRRMEARQAQLEQVVVSLTQTAAALSAKTA